MLYNHSDFLNVTFVAQAVFIFCFFVSSLFVSSNAYANFLAVFTSLIFAAFGLYSYYSLRINITRTNFGIVLGGTFVLVMISLQTSIFWGQYGNCEPYHNLDKQTYHSSRSLIGVDCSDTHAMKSLCAFAVFMFLSYLFLIGLLYRFKDDILGSAPLNEGYAPVATIAHEEPGDRQGRAAGGANEMQ